MFLDTLTSGEQLGSGTINNNNNNNNTNKTNFNENNRASQKHVQINETQNTRFNTQTRRDLADLEQVNF